VARGPRLKTWAGSMAEQHDWEAVLKGVIQQMARANVSELELRSGDLRVKIRRAQLRPQAAATPQHQMETGKGEVEVDAVAEGMHTVVAPLTGVFYDSPNPNSAPYVEPGDWVEPETVVGLIETMKVFNEVVADCRGRVVAIKASRGQLVHAGDPLLLVDPNASPDRDEVVR